MDAIAVCAAVGQWQWRMNRERSFFGVVVVTVRSLSRSAARMENTHQGIFPNLVVVVVVVVVVVLVVVAAWCCSCWLMHHHPHC